MSFPCSQSARRPLVVCAVLLLSLVLAGCGSAQQAQSPDGSTNIKVGTIPIDATSQVFYAKEQGYFEEEGLNVEIQTITNGAAIVSAVQSGALQIGCSNVVSLATAVERGLSFDFVAPGSLHTSDTASTALMVAGDSQVESAADLNDGVIAINGVKNITEVGARSWIEENGGDPESVKFIEIPFPQMGAALAEGRVDAAVIAEPALTQAEESGARVLGDPYSAISDQFLITAQFATSAWAEENPEAVEKFARAIEKGNKWANENPEESAQVLQQYTEISPEVVGSMTRALNGEQFDPALVQPPLDAATKFGILQKPLDAKTLTANSAS